MAPRDIEREICKVEHIGRLVPVLEKLLRPLLVAALLAPGVGVEQLVQGNPDPVHQSSRVPAASTRIPQPLASVQLAFRLKTLEP